MTNSTMTDIAAKTLGDSTSYAVYTDQYDASLLNPMPRNLARRENDIYGDEFLGFDVWHCYEATFLTNFGHPVSGVLKIVYPSSTENMVESKSMKLFLNSFDMCKMGKSIDEAIINYAATVRKCLSECLDDARVEVKFFRHVDIFNCHIELADNTLIERATMYDVAGTDQENDNINYLYDGRIHSDIIQHFKSKSQHIQLDAFESLRSRCRHTKQKDTGLAIVAQFGNENKAYKAEEGERTFIYTDSIYRKINELRELNEFHEFCAERLFVELQNYFNSIDETAPELAVTLLYTRRGSLDINPVRYSRSISKQHYKKFIAPFVDVNNLTTAAVIQ